MSTQDPQDTREAPQGATLVHAAREALTKSLWGLCAIVEAAGCDCEEDCEGCAVAEIAEMLGGAASYCADEANTLASAVDRADDADGEANWIANLDVPGARDAVVAYETAAEAARALCGEGMATKTTPAGVDLPALLQATPRGPWDARVETRMVGAESVRVGVIRARGCDEDLAPIVWNPYVAELMAKAPELARDLLVAQAEVSALRAMREGRTTPPTPAELLVHESAGGRWRCVVPTMLHMCADALHKHAAFMHIESLASLRLDSLWWALDGDARLTAWPVVP